MSKVTLTNPWTQKSSITEPINKSRPETCNRIEKFTAYLKQQNKAAATVDAYTKVAEVFHDLPSSQQETLRSFASSRKDPRRKLLFPGLITYLKFEQTGI